MAYQQKLEKAVDGWRQRQGFGELAKRYAFNLANGRFLWRNRIGTEQVEVRVAHLVDGRAQSTWTFDAKSLSLRDFDTNGNTEDISALAKTIESGLKGEQYVLLEIIAFVRIGNGQEVFPSQELILGRGRGDKSKTLYQVDNIAAIHSQKIGNAIRTIDTWYPETDGQSATTLGPIAIEPYGSVTTLGKAFRAPANGKRDFYTLLDNWVLKDKVPDENDQNYVIAVLIRGGVFGEAD
jgi:CRISPR-associated protein Csy3